MAVTVVCGRQHVTVVERSERAGDGIEPDICNIGRGSPQQPVDVRLSDHVSLSRRAAQVRCIDGSWWQIRQVGANGLTLKTERGVIMPVTDDWCDVPARFGVAYVTVTTLAETFEFKVTPNLSDVAANDPTGTEDAAVDPVNVATRIIPKVGYWRVAVVLCEPALCDESERIPTNPEIVRRLDQLGLEAEGFTERAVEKRIKYLYDITGVEPGDRLGLRRRLTEARVVTRDDVDSLLTPP
jgi:hypothetical protein